MLHTGRLRSVSLLSLSAALALWACGTSGGDSRDSNPNLSGGGSAGTTASGGPGGTVASAGTQATGGAGAGGDGGTATSGVGTGGASAGSGGGAGASGSDGGAGSNSGPPFGHPGATAAPTYDDFTLWVVEDFEQPLDLDNDPIWAWSDGGFQSHRFVRDAISFGDGAMTITFSETPQDSSCSHSNYGIAPAMARSSGELRSRYNLFRYGRYEMGVRAPSVQPDDSAINGNYIASLFIFRQPGCQEWREIDLEITGDSPGYLVTNLITGDVGSCDKSEVREDFDLATNFRTGFRTVGFEWLPGTVRFYQLDDSGDETTLRTLTDARVPDLPAKIMANLWVFGSSFAFGGTEGENNEYPLSVAYDFIRFYKWDQETQYPCAAMDASCLEAGDLDLSGNNGCDGLGNQGDFASCMQCGATVHQECTAACP